MEGGAAAVAGREPRRLARDFYARDVRLVARELLGKTLVRRDRGVRRAARIVEAEAYAGRADLASHARFGPTPRARIMFGPPGFAYVFLVYGMHHCVNAVAGPEGFGAAVLLRAGEPIEGCRGEPRGPARLCRALGITRRSCNGLDLCGERLFVEDAPAPAERIRSGPRVGVGYAGRWAAKPWRYWLEGNPWVSGRGERRPGRGGSARTRRR